MNSLCSYERLELALAGRLNADEESMLHLHLEDCELCEAELERLSGGEQASRDIAAMLVPDDLDDALPLHEECSTADFIVDHLEPSDDPAVLGRLGGYDVLEIIGRGGMGVVLKGFDRELKRFVAIKALDPHLAHSALARKRFAREAQAAAAVVNLHVIAIHQVQPNGQLPFLVMPLLTGESLAHRLKARGTLELNEILRIGMQAAEGLAAAHGQGLIHRDVKPANILLEKGVERAVLTDFGLARAADDVSMTRWGIIAGTPEYMSPEQARGKALDGRSDLFSLGCVLYEMATGVSPFRTDLTMATLRRIVDEQPAAMASLVPELPPWFCHIVERLLSKDPAQRFASASEVSQLLEECLSHLQQPTSVPLPASLVSHADGRRSICKVTQKGMMAMLGTIGMISLAMVLLQATEAPDISGQWTSEEWGTVLLEANGSEEYEGTFSGSGKDEPVSRNDAPESHPGADSIPGGTPDGPGVRLKSGPHGPAPIALDLQSGFGFYVGFETNDQGARQSRDDIPSKTNSGKLHLKWSRVERRFNGTWGKGADRRGAMSIRLIDKDIRGGWTTDEDVQLETGTPLLGDLSWKRSLVKDGGTRCTREDEPLKLTKDMQPILSDKCFHCHVSNESGGQGGLRLDDETVLKTDQSRNRAAIVAFDSLKVNEPIDEAAFAIDGKDANEVNTVQDREAVTSLPDKLNIGLLQTLQGIWIIEKSTSGLGENPSEEQIAQSGEVSIDGSLFMIPFTEGDKRADVPMLLEIQWPGSPQGVEVTFDPNGTASRALGIIDCHGDRLRLCIGQAFNKDETPIESSRPKIFAAGSDVAFLECRRKPTELPEPPVD